MSQKVSDGEEDMNACGPCRSSVTKEANELALVHASKSGDLSAFEKLVSSYDGELLGVARYLTKNREDSQDVVQEALLKAFQHLGQFQENSRFSTWLFRIIVNESMRRIRKVRRSREVSMDDREGEHGELPIDIADRAPTPEEVFLKIELLKILLKTLQQLDPNLRTAIVLRDLKGLSLRETAEFLELSRAAVKARHWRGRLELRDRFERAIR